MLTNCKICLPFLLAVGLWPGWAYAQFHEKFDSSTPSWQRSETDCIIPNARWRQRRTNELESRIGPEMARYGRRGVV